MTDIAFAYRHSTDLKRVCAALDAKQKFIKPHCPWQNGKVERLNRTLATEWGLPPNLHQQRRPSSRTCTWLEHYNTVRRHSLLRGKPPISRL